MWVKSNLQVMDTEEFASMISPFKVTVSRNNIHVLLRFNVTINAARRDDGVIL